MEKYCITLEQAKGLLELGAFARFGESQYSWFVPSGEVYNEKDTFVSQSLKQTYIPNYITYPAYHVGELGEILPNEIDDGTGNYFFTKSGQHHAYKDVTGRILRAKNGQPIEDQGIKPEAEARGNLLICLLENNLI
jgi:hypothetical protein